MSDSVLKQEIPQEHPDVHSITMKMRGRSVTHEEALKSAHRLVNSHFHNPDSARCTIPVDYRDDDVTVIDYIHEQANLTLLSDSQLANQERLVGEMQELRQVIEGYLHHPDFHHGQCHGGNGYHTCDLCKKSRALLAPKDTPTEPTQEK